MEKKNRYLLYSIFYASLLLVAIGIYTYGYNPPTCNPPGCNLPAPINASLQEQTKAGNLTIQGNLTTGGFTMSAGAGADKVLTTNASGVATWQEAGGGWDGILPNYTTAQRDTLFPSPSTGMMIYNTDYDQIQTFTKTAWSGITGNKDLGIECASSMDCASGFCVDTVCCDTSPVTCNGDCEACNLVGKMGICTVRANLNNTEVTTACYYCNGTSDTSVAYTGYTGVNCTGSNACYSGTCFASYCDEDNDARFTKVVAQCPSGRYQSTAGDDCNDSCATCYPGSTAYTSSPDGKDQDCDGSIDETACTYSHTCRSGTTCTQYCATLTDCGCSGSQPQQCYSDTHCGTKRDSGSWVCTTPIDGTVSKYCDCYPNKYY